MATDVETGVAASVLVADAVVLIRFRNENTSTTEHEMEFTHVKTTLPLVPVGTAAPQSSQHAPPLGDCLAISVAETPPIVTVERLTVINGASATTR